MKIYDILIIITNYIFYILNINGREQRSAE